MESLKGKLTEEEFIYLVCFNCPKQCLYPNYCYKEKKLHCPYVSAAICRSKKLNIIKQNPVEKAEKLIKYLKNYNVMTTDMAEMIVVSEEAIQYLKKQLEEKK